MLYQLLFLFSTRLITFLTGSGFFTACITKVLPPRCRLKYCYAITDYTAILSTSVTFRKIIITPEFTGASDVYTRPTTSKRPLFDLHICRGPPTRGSEGFVTGLPIAGASCEGCGRIFTASAVIGRQPSWCLMGASSVVYSRLQVYCSERNWSVFLPWAPGRRNVTEIFQRKSLILVSRSK